MTLIAYLFCAGAGYLAGLYLPDGPAAPYLPLLLSYHLLLLFLVCSAVMKGDQNFGLSLPFPVAILTHFAFAGALIGMVMGRQYVPMFSLLQYVVPGLAPFEAKWLFEGSSHRRPTGEPEPLPPGSDHDYNEFLAYLQQRHRKFERAGRSVRDEYVAWQEHRQKLRAIAR